MDSIEAVVVIVVDSTQIVVIRVDCRDVIVFNVDNATVFVLCANSTCTKANLRLILKRQKPLVLSVDNTKVVVSMNVVLVFFDTTWLYELNVDRTMF